MEPATDASALSLKVQQILSRREEIKVHQEKLRDLEASLTDDEKKELTTGKPAAIKPEKPASPGA